VLLFNHHGPYPRIQGHSLSRTPPGPFRCRSPRRISWVLPDRDLSHRPQDLPPVCRWRSWPSN